MCVNTRKNVGRRVAKVFGGNPPSPKAPATGVCDKLVVCMEVSTMYFLMPTMSVKEEEKAELATCQLKGCG